MKLGTTEEYIQNPIHPYTKSLISAIPHPNPIVEKGRISEELLIMLQAEYIIEEVKNSM